MSESHWLLDPTIAFLNHGSFGACPRVVLEYQRALQTRLEEQPMTFFTKDLEDLMDEAREKLAKFVDCRSANLAFVPNATSGVNSVLRSFPFQPGDEILTTNLVYPACWMSMKWVARRYGLKTRQVEIPFPIEHPDQVTQVILNAVGPHTRVALLDHIASSTGLVLPLEALVPALEERGVATLIDGAHAPGSIPLRIRELNPSYYTGNCHKWLFTPKGAAFLWAREDRQGDLVPLSVSYGLEGLRPGRSLFHDRFDWTGTCDPTPYLCIPKALEFGAQLYPGGWGELERCNHRMAVRAGEQLNAALKQSPLYPPSMTASMATVRLPGKTEGPDPLLDYLLEHHHIQAKTSPEPFRSLRISCQAYNRPEEYEKLAQVLKDLKGEFPLELGKGLAPC